MNRSLDQLNELVQVHAGMQKIRILAATALMGAFFLSSPQQGFADDLTIEQKRTMAREVLEIAFDPGTKLEEKKAKIPNYINRQKYIQHNPYAADGIDGLFGFLEWIENEYGFVSISVKRVLIDGNLAAVHSHYKYGKDDILGKATVDIFRFEGGRIVEHWDVIQDVPEKSANTNTMF